MHPKKLTLATSKIRGVNVPAITVEHDYSHGEMYGVVSLRDYYGEEVKITLGYNEVENLITWLIKWYKAEGITRRYSRSKDFTDEGKADLDGVFQDLEIANLNLESANARAEKKDGIIKYWQDKYEKYREKCRVLEIWLETHQCNLSYAKKHVERLKLQLREIEGLSSDELHKKHVAANVEVARLQAEVAGLKAALRDS